MIDETTEKNIRAIYDREQSEIQKLSIAHKIAGKIADFSGTVLFLVLNAVFFAAWIAINLIKPFTFDPYPFTLLTLWLSLESIFLSTFLLISQNASTALSDKRHNLDLQVNLLAEQESTAMFKVILLMAKKLEISEEDLKELRAAAEDTSPEKVLEKIQEIEDEPT